MNKTLLELHVMKSWIKVISALSGYISVPQEIAAKTYAYYLRTISSYVRTLYNGGSEGEFIDSMAELIPAQLTRAWNEGMRENGLDPVEDMIEEWADKLEELILNEFDYVDNFAADITAAVSAGSGIDALLSRAEIWANRYNDVLNISILTTKEQKLKWILGATEEHCSTCSALNGIVAFASEWELSGVHPQNPPNAALECGGWRCDCSLEPTSERHTRGAWDRIMAVAG